MRQQTGIHQWQTFHQFRRNAHLLQMMLMRLNGVRCFKQYETENSCGNKLEGKMCFSSNAIMWKFCLPEGSLIPSCKRVENCPDSNQSTSIITLDCGVNFKWTPIWVESVWPHILLCNKVTVLHLRLQWLFYYSVLLKQQCHSVFDTVPELTSLIYLQCKQLCT